MRTTSGQYILFTTWFGKSTLILLLVCMSCAGPAGKTKNHLGKASSRYLLDHADNPVDWYEWGEEALSRAKSENKPLLISIGYSSCHWCHVMERESFMDPEAAALMNENFICIKVDREERPDIDNIYLRASQLLNGGEAGWPLNAFALPDGKPFFAGTYYSKENWMNLLKQITDSYNNKTNKVMLQANSITFGMIDSDSLLLMGHDGRNGVNRDLYQDLFKSAYKEIDPVNGGMRGATKFPTPSLWEFFLQYHYLTGSKDALDVTVNTLTKMARGGINDHLGGGFARYATDSNWRVPHFEKMLSDNAQLISLYAHAYQLTRNEYFRMIASEIIVFVEKELAAPGGGYYSSVNADSDGEEGRFYAWSHSELRGILDEKSFDLISSYFNITEAGNWEKDRNILYATEDPAAFASDRGLTETEFNRLLLQSKKVLLAVRNKRTRPRVDDKVLTSWNALLLKAYADAYAAFGSDALLEKALAIGKLVQEKMVGDEGRLCRNLWLGKPSTEAFLDDYAFLAKALIRLYEVSFDKQWLTLAEKITGYAVENFYDQKSGYFFYTAATETALAVRKIEMVDNVLPSSNAVMGEVLLSLGTLLESRDHEDKNLRMLSNIAGRLRDLVAFSGEWGSLAGLKAYDKYEVAIMGTQAMEKNRELQKNYLPTCLFLGGVEENLPLMENKLPASGTLIYVCSNRTCKRPVEGADQAMQQILNPKIKEKGTVALGDSGF